MDWIGWWSCKTMEGIRVTKKDSARLKNYFKCPFGKLGSWRKGNYSRRVKIVRHQENRDVRQRKNFHPLHTTARLWLPINARKFWHRPTGANETRSFQYQCKKDFLSSCTSFERLKEKPGKLEIRIMDSQTVDKNCFPKCWKLRNILKSGNLRMRMLNGSNINVFKKGCKFTIRMLGMSTFREQVFVHEGIPRRGAWKDDNLQYGSLEGRNWRYGCLEDWELTEKRLEDWMRLSEHRSGGMLKNRLYTST